MRFFASFGFILILFIDVQCPNVLVSYEALNPLVKKMDCALPCPSSRKTRPVDGRSRAGEVPLRPLTAGEEASDLADADRRPGTAASRERVAQLADSVNAFDVQTVVQHLKEARQSSRCLAVENAYPCFKARNETFLCCPLSVF